MTNEKKVYIRAEQSTDAEGVFRLHRDAFGREDEAKMAERVRASEGYVPHLSLIATNKDGSLIGHALFSRAEIVDENLRYEVSYYPKFGFQPARPHGFILEQFKVPNEVFMVNTLSQNAAIKGELRYPQPFFN